MSNYEDDLREERQLNELLKAKLRQSDERIATLTALSLGKSDPFRDLLLRELGVDQRKTEGVAASVKKTAVPEDIPEGLKKIIQFIGPKEVSLSDLAPFIALQKIEVGKDPRRVMFDFKKTGLLENFRRGFYRLSATGLTLLTEMENANNLV